jgi:DNA-binding transcriptional LysR family regulator
MELRQLEYFVAVARRRNFTRAADDVHVTQSALSQQVRRLEAELGVKLLERTPGGVELTPAGADLLRRAEAILHEAAKVRADMDEHAGLVRGLVRVAGTAVDAQRLLEELARFHAEHPGIRIALRHGSEAEAIALARRGAVDVALAAIGAAGAPAGLDVLAAADEPLWVVAAPEDPLAAAGEVALAELRERAFILAEPGTALREIVVGACERAGFGPVPIFEVGDPVSVRFLAHAGLGVSLVPASWLRMPGPAVGVARLAAPEPRHRLALLAAPGAPSSAGRLLRDRLAAALRPEDLV